MRFLFAALLLAAAPLTALAQDTAPLAPVTVTEWKAVYGQIEARDRIPARARIGGTVLSLHVTEGDEVSAGQELAEVVDDKIAFQLSSVDAQIQAVSAQLTNAEDELARGQTLLGRGVITTQNLDGLRTQVDVLKNQKASAEANRAVIAQQVTEGKVLAPIAGKVLAVPVTPNSVVMPGEPIAVLGGGGFFLRLAVPERFAGVLVEGAEIAIETPTGPAQGKLVKLYPLIENGRVIADVEVADLPETFVDARVLVRLPVGSREALMVPTEAVKTVSGLDFVTIRHGVGTVQRAVVLGGSDNRDGVEMVEVLTGLNAGDVVIGHE